MKPGAGNVRGAVNYGGAGFDGSLARAGVQMGDA